MYPSNRLNIRPTEITPFAILELYHVYYMYVAHIYNIYNLCTMHITHKYNLYAMYITYTRIHIYEPKAHIPEFSAILSAWL